MQDFSYSEPANEDNCEIQVLPTDQSITKVWKKKSQNKTDKSKNRSKIKYEN